MQPSVSQHYNSVISLLEIQLKKKLKADVILFVFRLITFLSIPAFIFLYFKYNSNALLLLFSFLIFILFIFGVNLDSKNKFKINLLKNKIQINQNEQRFLDHKFHDRPTGSDYSNINPHFADDFDIFGEGSLFQYLNRCATKTGEKKLAEDLSNFGLNSELIKERQSAIKELSEKSDSIQNFQAYGMLFSETGNEQTNLQSWLDETSPKLKWLRFLCISIPILNASWIALVIAGLFTFNSLLSPILLSLLIVFLNLRIINKAHVKLGNTAKTFEKYKYLLTLIENETFESAELIRIQKKLSSNSIKASESLTYLNKLLSRFDIRYNVIVSFLLNSLVIFDIQIYSLLEKWKEKNKSIVPQWFSVLSEIDSLISFAVFAFNNNPSLIYPEISNEDFLLQAEELGHPILHHSVRVCNNVSLSGNPAVMVITGANMAGKSTFLRTISVNLLLAMNGSPVCAKKFLFTPCVIMSSIKIQDSLFKNQSYFYAELLRIQEIIKHTQTNTKTLVILDEILRGTNTRDKQTGSLGILEKLISQNAVVIIATHDLVIGELEKKYPKIVVNQCFEVELTNDQLVFDYKLKRGISQKMNASYLMKKLEIID